MASARRSGGGGVGMDEDLGRPGGRQAMAGSGGIEGMEFDWLPAGATPDMLAAEARGMRADGRSGARAPTESFACSAARCCAAGRVPGPQHALCRGMPPSPHRANLPPPLARALVQSATSGCRQWRLRCSRKC